MFDRLSITALGSCRIVNPLRLAAQAGTIKLLNAGVYGYMHATGEILQYLDIREGLPLPVELLPYLAGGRTEPPRAAPADPRAFVVEISSLKTLLFGDWVLQINYFADRFRAHPDLLKALYAAPDADQRDRRAMELARLPDFARPEPFDRHVLTETHATAHDRETLERDMLQIVRQLPRPVLFVTHLNLPDAAGRQMENRACIGAWMAEIGRAHGLHVFDPTPHVLAYGSATAMAEDGTSRTHYAPAFEPVLLERLLSAVRGLLAAPGGGERGSPRSPVPLQIAPPRALDGTGLHLRALECLRAGNLSAASAAARAAIALEPPSPEGMATLAQVALRRGEPETALRYAQQVRIPSPGNAAAIVTAAKALTKLKRFEEAAGLWEEMTAVRRHTTWPLLEAARCRLRARQPDRALALADAVLSRDPVDAVALAVKAEALRMLGRNAELPAVGEALADQTPEAALAIMQWMIASGHAQGLTRIARRVAASPQGIPATDRDDLCRRLRAAAEHALAQNFWETGGEALRALLVLAPEDRAAARALAKLAAAWLEPARAALRTGDLQAAEAAYDAALTIDPDQLRTLREAAAAAEKRSAWERAADLCEQIDRLTGSDSRSLIRAARAAELAGQEERALDLYRRAAAADPGNARAQASIASLARRLAKRARTLETAGDGEGAARVALLVVAANPQDPVCSKLLRRSVASLAGGLKAAVADGDIPRQEALAQQLLRIDPQRFEALRVLSKLRLTDGRLDEAADLLRRLTAVQGDVAAHWIKLGRCLRLMKSYEAARDAAQEALARDPGNSAAHKILADLPERRPT